MIYFRFIDFRIETCPRDWLNFNNACYQVNLDRKNIQDATDSCLTNGAGILTLRSSEEETFLREELEKDNLNNMFYWLGMDRFAFIKLCIIALPFSKNTFEDLNAFFSRFLKLLSII